MRYSGWPLFNLFHFTGINVKAIDIVNSFVPLVHSVITEFLRIFFYPDICHYFLLLSVPLLLSGIW
jgi:hypothetical protein